MSVELIDHSNSKGKIRDPGPGFNPFSDCLSEWPATILVAESD